MTKYEYMGTIFRTIWGLYSNIIMALVVIPTSFVVFITSLIFGRRAQRFNLWLCTDVSSPSILFLSAIWVRVHGADHIEKGKSYVIVSNHVSYLDIFTNPTTFMYKIRFTYLGKAELGKTPFFGVIARNLAVLVDRSSMTSRKKSYDGMKDTLHRGISIAIYPEGTRNKTEDLLLPFQDGAFKLAKDMKVPILVNTLVHMKDRNNPNRKIDVCPGFIDSYIDEPFDTEDMDVAAIRQKVRDIMEGHLRNAK